MIRTKLIPTLFVVALLAVAACSSSSGEGSPPPHDVNVVVPAGSSVSQ